MMIDLCSPREGLLYYSSYKFVGCWTFCEAPLCDPGNVHWCHCLWSSRAGVSSFLFQSSLLAECGAKCNILYTQIWTIQKVVQHIISLGEHLESSVLKQKAEMSLGSSCRKTWALTHQLKFTLGSCGCGNKPQSFQMPLLHCLGDNVAFPVPASAGAVWARSDFGE